ncbi:putative SP-containing membrane protein [Vairimorpha necatrix]|uniref:SP-containing membrane protein n=1 Tax=Vairimorpha necatrix TaxID=6039 RepID=A0AAX4JEU2_9MICR
MLIFYIKYLFCSIEECNTKEELNQLTISKYIKLDVPEFYLQKSKEDETIIEKKKTVILKDVIRNFIQNEIINSSQPYKILKDDAVYAVQKISKPIIIKDWFFYFKFLWVLIVATAMALYMYSLYKYKLMH